MSSEKERLKKEIAANKARLKEIEKEEKIHNRYSAIRKLEDITEKEKIDFFDKMYSDAESELKDHQEGNGGDSDEHYAWEAYIEILAKDRGKFWDYWNSLY